MATALTLEPAPLPDRSLADEPLYEIVNGQRVELPPMSSYATWIAFRLGSRLEYFTEPHQLGNVATEMLFILDVQRGLKRRPDLAFVSVEKWPLDRVPPEHGDWEVIPDLAVEVVSPNDLLEDVFAKIEEYFQCGVRQVWLVIPRVKQIYVYDAPTIVHILRGADELDGGGLLPGFRLSVATIFNR